jgi:von Willebrand factor type A domain/Trypsin-like peptidase domain
MAHIVGTVQPVSPQVVIGPDSGLPPTTPNTWAFDLDPGPPPAGGIKFIIVHLKSLIITGNNRVEIDLGYDKDVITATTDSEFWSRPVNLSAFPSGKVPIRYITSGAAVGGVTLDRFGRGERHDGDGDPSSNSNCDPFLLDANYTEPTFNPSLFCATPPDIENVDCVTAAGDVRKTVAPSVGMIVHVDLAADGSTEILTSFSGTLVGTDLVLTAGQSVALSPTQLRSASIIFNYQTTCAGARPGSYTGRFHKAKRIVKLGFFGVVDYAVLQLSVPAAGLGLTPIVMRPDLPAAGEQIFCIHHPEGAVKRLSGKHATFKTVISSDLNAVVVDLDVASGSTGAGLFDASGQVVGVLSTGTACNIAFYPTAAALADIGNQVDDPIGGDVMIVLDRSGSMSLDAGTGRPKIDEARDAASLFIQLVQSDAASQIGLVSFSTAASNPVDFALQPVNAANKLALTGPAPFTGGIVGGLIADGTTSIGDGLDAARGQMPVLLANVRSILLLTDGLQNTPPLIADVAGLDGINISAVGFGPASNLNGALLTELSETHNGIYMRAGDGLDLKKFFSLAFGNIFASGALLDPPGRLKTGDKESKPIRFNVCGETVITIVVGWDKADAELAITVKTPGGATITGSSSGVEHAAGRTWAFLRIKLPHGGERNGAWSVTVGRSGFGSVGAGPIDYFVNVIAGGSAKLRRWPGRDLYFTGEAINPVVRLAGGDIRHAKVSLTVTRPAASVGTILARANKPRPPAAQKGEPIPSLQTTMLAIEKSTRKPIVDYTEHRFELSSDPVQTNVTARGAGLHGTVLTDFLNVEGTYTFHAVATYGKDCVSSRELQWSVEVEVGVDQTKSDVKITTGATLPDKKKLITVVIVPRDAFGNHVGPGRPNAFTVTGTPGTTLTGAVRDNGDGSYTVGGVNDPKVGKPGLVLARPVRCLHKSATRPGARPRKR